MALMGMVGFGVESKAKLPYIEVICEGSMSSILTVTAKGQVTLRRNVLRHLGVAPGDRVAVDLLPDGRAELRAVKPAASIDGFIGCLRRPGARSLSLDEIAEIAAQGWAKRR
jgi:bifunctional DNA-binding transcriptional regulator/antitoxin component of YhaV-PrlF toxin-antitoxin module